MTNGLNPKNRGRFFGVILGLVALMTLFGFSSLYAGDLLVYTALEDDELAVYIPAFKKPPLNFPVMSRNPGTRICPVFFGIEV